jgi:hypothetical protein
VSLLLPTEFSAGFSTGFSTGTGWILFETLAPPPKPDPGGQGEDYGKAAPTALVVLLLLFVAAALLVRSMNKHLRRVPESFDDDSTTQRRED